MGLHTVQDDTPALPLQQVNNGTIAVQLNVKKYRIDFIVALLVNQTLQLP